MARKNLLLGLDEEELTAVNSENGPAPRPPPTLGTRGAVGAMGRSLERISADIDAAKALEQRLLSGANVVEIDASLVDASFVTDRLDESEADCTSLLSSIRTHGQQVPILVRPHPEVSGRYQIAYGHRRLRALRELGQRVKAVVRSLSDDELVIAQGQENSARRDLSFIERASFSVSLEDRGFGRETIMAALAVDKTELSRLISCRKALPDELVKAIGAAPKAGRRRWMDLAEHLKAPRASKLWARICCEAEFAQLDSDSRFAAVFSALATKNSPAKTTSWIDHEGRKIARVDEDSGWLRINVDKSVDAEFGAYVVAQLPALLKAFQVAQRDD
ncbi:plasmid partitioning protein RepB [Methylocystis sp. H62]|jgi:ParB family chromosome partitioning protein|uniref:Plasmid partitioning protein RepB n=1 Tax=Methylocystis rosea TaxID=173366 RepID=A0ABX6ENK9_9HYPH|nr:MULTISPECIES: plasmid partitioning protein RepB [Methylocystis]MBG0792084.1 plasmid partitioning protein RepB [Methylocystis sp. H62]MBG0797215.1 plasmid partitioning protein RepB [Methylocystis sp. L43]MBG0804193.1 plasmid partitioning protein RepB [Methylocystis sp. H15]QGM95999.1 plasmid partitioning protein RepB [Methylocystis rosea]